MHPLAASRRRPARVRPMPKIRRTFVALAAAAAFAAACSSTPPSPEELCPEPVPGDRVEMDDFTYAPGCVAADAGATIEVPNVGDAPHTFTIEGTEVDLYVEAGESTTLDLTGVAPGTYEVTCTLHPQMKAAIQVG